MDSGEQASIQLRLRQRLDDLLEQSLGLNVLPRFDNTATPLAQLGLPASPLRGAAAMAATYLTAFVVLPLIIARLTGVPAGPALGIITVFQIYGAFWSGWATATTRMTSHAVVSILEAEVLPRLSTNTAAWIAGELDKREFRRSRLLAAAWSIGIAAGALATWLLQRDLLQRDLLDAPWWLLLFWGAGWALLYTTAAKVVSVSRFYAIFAGALIQDPGCLYPLNPARSPLVASLKAVSKTMLLFWFGIAVSIALIIPFNLYALSIAGKIGDTGEIGPLHLGAYRFVLGHLVITALFSIGVGTIVFLQSEAALRRAVRAAASVELDRLKEYTSRILSGELSEDRLKHLAEVNALYSLISAGGGYQAMLIGGLSVVLPFVPLLTLLLNKIG